MRRLLQCFQESVESRLREHVHLINNINLITGTLRWYTHLLYQAADIVNRIVRGRIQLMNIKRITILERDARWALTASLAVCLQIGAVNGFSQYTRAGGFAHPPRPAKQKCLRQLIIFNSVFKGVGYMLLTNNGIKSSRAVFTCRNDEIIHSY